MSCIFAFNWKMNPATLAMAVDLLDSYAAHTAEATQPVIVLPPTAFASDLFEYAQDMEIPGISFGVQDISAKADGAMTGQTSATMAESIGMQYALIGHSETREYAAVTDAICAAKIQQAVAANLTPILCVGHGMTEKIDIDILTQQIVTAVSPVESVDTPVSVIIAYEPVWAIGTGKTASVDHINQVMSVIRSILSGTLPMIAETATILYGGSVTSNNIVELSTSTADGFLVGGASLKSEEVAALASAG